MNLIIGVRRSRFLSALALCTIALMGTRAYLFGQDRSAFPDGYDAVQAAPKSHKVIFENALVRMLEVSVPASGSTEPMHHHRWPSFFLSWDTGGKTPHVRYHRADGTVVDEPSQQTPIHPGAWRVAWMKPEPMHSIEVIENPNAAAIGASPPLLRVEIKCGL
jgi:hypothetical protein